MPAAFYPSGRWRLPIACRRIFLLSCSSVSPRSRGLRPPIGFSECPHSARTGFGRSARPRACLATPPCELRRRPPERVRLRPAPAPCLNPMTAFLRLCGRPTGVGLDPSPLVTSARIGSICIEGPCFGDRGGSNYLTSVSEQKAGQTNRQTRTRGSTIFGKE